MKKVRLPTQRPRAKVVLSWPIAVRSFLDEIGELPKDVQVKLLRVLEEKKIDRLGASKPISIDVRTVAATNRTLSEEVREGRFREDLFYRIVVAYLKLPPLRDRPGDLGLLSDHLIEQINTENEGQPSYKRKEISASAKNMYPKSLLGRAIYASCKTR